ncbi:aldehyde dehydrogenase [Psychromonas marina]|uniref:Aldehyde dehydrogenase n=1 Tax=Psychromonas marina TaxID=88364 RepID=A0ABQ6DWJ0_9GAMM|nr:coniferyl aldehyde dehydrogenase [Psychromonas marina]GLS89516.1 aldehyde dehydrogenase [Psychromonas marina]
MNTVNNNAQQISLEQLLATQRSAYKSMPAPSYQSRVDKLNQLKAELMNYKDRLVSALASDYGHRSGNDTIIADILPCVTNINYTVKNLKSWMKPDRRHAGLLLAPSSVAVHYQPLGVVGIIVPWNFPVMLAIGPLITAIAAGNRAMLKMSEFTPATNKVLIALLAEIFSQEEVAVVEGEANIAAQFSSLPFDHLLFTGSTTIGRHVMRSAAENLTPVTLELGGKSPVIIAPDMDVEIAVQRLIYGKCLNAGQICVSPDYVLCPEEKVEALIAAYQARFNKMYPDFASNSDYGNVINQRQYSRLLSVLDDAKQKGATITSATEYALDSEGRKMPTQLVTNVRADMTILQDEIFGPLLPIIAYKDLGEAIDHINNNDRPLALYIMSFDTQTQQSIIQQTHSGGVCINETIFHVAAEDAPFGGIGPSGMGSYHGKEGFLTFSHAKTVLKSGKFNAGLFIQPPYGTKLQALLMKLFLR